VKFIAKGQDLSEGRNVLIFCKYYLYWYTYNTNIEEHYTIKMKTKTKYEEQIIHEMRDLPVPLQKKIVRIVHVFREEMRDMLDNEKAATQEFLSSCGKWQDSRSVEDQISDIYDARKNRSHVENLL